MESNNKELVINREYDYSNILPLAEYIAYLVKYCSQVYEQLLKFEQEDEEANEKIKLDYQEYKFKRIFSQGLKVYISEKNYRNTITCTDYETFKSAIEDGNLKNVRNINVELNLNFRRGNNDNFEEHKNEFSIEFRPYEINFIRKSNYKDEYMDQIENKINEIMKQFPIANCIFCDK